MHMYNQHRHAMRFRLRARLIAECRTRTAREGHCQGTDRDVRLAARLKCLHSCTIYTQRSQRALLIDIQYLPNRPTLEECHVGHIYVLYSMNGYNDFVKVRL